MPFPHSTGEAARDAAEGCSTVKRSISPEAEMAELKRRRRLEKNRESARESRRRKKENKERLEAQLASLEEENLNLRLRSKLGDEADEAENSEISKIKDQLDGMVASGGADGEILQTVDLLKERYADYGSAHTNAAEFHLTQLARLLRPTLTTKACMHAILQTRRPAGDRAVEMERKPSSHRPPESGPSMKMEGAESAMAFSEGPGMGESNAQGTVLLHERQERTKSTLDATVDSALSPKTEHLSRDERPATLTMSTASTATGVSPTRRSVDSGDKSGWVDMWGSLVEVLEASPEQQQAMRDQAGAILDLAADLEGTMETLRRLKLLLADRNQTLDEEMAEIQRILTPTQTAKFVLWVSKNGACVHMLNQLWDKLQGGAPR